MEAVQATELQDGADQNSSDEEEEEEESDESEGDDVLDGQEDDVRLRAVNRRCKRKTWKTL